MADGRDWPLWGKETVANKVPPFEEPKDQQQLCLWSPGRVNPSVGPAQVDG